MEVKIQEASPKNAVMNASPSLQQESVLNDYLERLEQAELNALQSVFPSLSYTGLVSVKSLEASSQWELNLPYSRLDLTSDVSVGRGSYNERASLKSALDANPLKVYEISVNLSRSVTELYNLGVLGESFYQEELKGAFSKVLAKVQLMVEKGLETEKGLFNLDAQAAGVNATSKIKHLNDYSLADLAGVKTLLEQIRTWANVISTGTAFGAKVDTLAAPISLASSVFESLITLGNTITTVKALLKEQLGINVVYALNADDTNRILLYAKDAVELFDVMHLQAFTNTSFDEGLEYLTQLKGANLEIPVVTRISPVVIKQPKAVHVIDMNASTK